MERTDRTDRRPRTTRPPSRSAQPVHSLTTATSASMRPTPGQFLTGAPQLSTTTTKGRSFRTSEVLEDVLDSILGVAEEHLGVLLEEQGVLHTGIPGSHGPFE